jgi:tetratricopeptide (TPR) repeat protein
MSKSICLSLSVLLLAAAGLAGQDALKAKLRDAATLQSAGDYAAAEDLLRSALKEAEDSHSADPRLAVAFNNLASIYHFQDRYPEAEWYFRKAIEIDRRASAPDPRLTARYLTNLAQIYLDTAQYGKAERLNLRALEAGLAASEPEAPERARLLVTIGAVAAGQHQYVEAETAYKQALAGEESHADSEDTYLALNDLTILYHETGRDAEALAFGERALRLADRLLSGNDPRLAKLLLTVGVLQQRVRGAEAAEPFYRRALSIADGAFGPGHRFTGELLATYANALRQMNRKTEAGKYARRAKAILAATQDATVTKNTVDVADFRRAR